MAAPQPSTQQQPPRQFNNGYFPNGTVSGPVPGATPLLPNQGRVIQSGPVRVLCVADVRGNLKSLNELAKSARADYIIHTGDFGFYDERSLDRIAEKTLKHVIQYSPLIGEDVRHQVAKIQPGTSIKERFRRDQLPLSELPHFLNNSMSFDVPVYSVWGACEDVQVLEKLRSGEYKIDKLHILDEAHSRLLDIGGVKLRLLGLGGAVVMHKLFDNGEGRTTIAGGQGTMWTTLLQMGELVDTANRVYDPSETRVLVTHASPAREGLLNQLSVTLKADFSISAGLHFRYGSSYNEFSVNPTLDHYRGKLAASKASFNDVWETVKSEVEPAVQDNEAQQKLLNSAIGIIEKMPSVASSGNPFGGPSSSSSGQVDESAFKNMWNFNLADAAFGWLVLEIEGGRIGTEMKAQGFNFAHRGQRNPVLQADMIKPGQAQVNAAASSNIAPGSTNATVPPPQSQPSRPTNASATGPPVAQAVQQGTVQTRPMQPARPGSTQTPAATAASRPVQQSNTTPTNVPPTQQSKSPAPAVAQGQASLAPVATTQTSKASTTPTPSAATNGASSAENKANGTTPSTSAGDEASKATPPPQERKPSSAIFINGVNSEEETRNLFTEEDKSKIQRVEQRGKAWVVHFSSTEEMQVVLKTTQQEVAKSAGPNRPVVKEYLENPPSYQRGQGGARNWNSNPRGGAQQSGYRSGGASDSEGGRGGRGAYRGSRGRGGDRGGRGGRGRGTFNKSGGEGGTSAGASSSPTTATGPGRA